jgi:hypothetical protein
VAGYGVNSEVHSSAKKKVAKNFYGQHSYENSTKIVRTAVKREQKEMMRHSCFFCLVLERLRWKDFAGKTSLAANGTNVEETKKKDHTENSVFFTPRTSHLRKPQSFVGVNETK